MKVLIVSNGFPNSENPNEYAFIKKFYSGLVANGVEVLVVSPVVFGKSKKGIELIENIRRPKYFSVIKSFAFLPKFFLHLKTRLKYKSFGNAVENSLKFDHFKPDAIYCHFLETAIPLTKLAQKLNVPLIAGIGESSFNRYEKNLMRTYISETLSLVSHFVSVSNLNKEFLINYYKVPILKVSVIPNGVEDSFFETFDKSEIRKKLNLPQDKFIVGFVGNFVERKGPLRVLAAIDELSDVLGMFIGSGKQQPEGGKVAFAGKVKNSLIPEYLAACDIFVLPTQNEGSCNAIIEAMAAGLPIISSDIPAIKEQVKNSYGILVDPMNISQIKKAILDLKEDIGLRERMAKNSKNESRNYSNSARILRILALLERSKLS